MTKPIPLYMAYGSNMNKGQMAYRCPDAEPAGTLWMPDYRLVFRGVADIIPAKGYSVPIAVWKITERCEKALDRYEGYPNLYRKEYFKLRSGELMMAYVMNRQDIAPPSDGYLAGIIEGYKDFGFDDDGGAESLNEAVKHSFRYATGRGHTPKRHRPIPKQSNSDNLW